MLLTVPRGFRQLYANARARISGEIRPLGVGLQKCFSVFLFALNSYTSSKTPVQCFVVIIQRRTKIAVFSTARLDSQVLSAVCIKLLDHKLFVETSGTN